MTGNIHRMIVTLVEQRSQGNSTIASSTKTRLILKGINPERYTPDSPDDPVVMAKIQEMAAGFGIKL